MTMAIQLLSLPDYQLAQNFIDIWEFPLDEMPTILPLNEAELTRARRFYFARHQRRFTVARAMMRLILSRYLATKAENLHFHYYPQGKPYLKSDQEIEFNLSHSKDLALLAIGQKFPLGVDLEFFSARPYEGIAQTLFSPTELMLFQGLPTTLKPHYFFKIWAEKEAFIKACGLGLSYPTQEFTVPLFSQKPTLVNDCLHEQEWLLASFMPQVICQAALCYHPCVKKIRYIRLAKIADLF